jgi:hypothetical protein
VDGGKEIPGGFVVASCDCPELLELAEEILDQVTLFVEFAIELARRRAVWSRRDCGGFAGRGQRVEDPAIGIEGSPVERLIRPVPDAALAQLSVGSATSTRN